MQVQPSMDTIKASPLFYPGRLLSGLFSEIPIQSRKPPCRGVLPGAVACIAFGGSVQAPPQKVSGAAILPTPESEELEYRDRGISEIRYLACDIPGMDSNNCVNWQENVKRGQQSQGRHHEGHRIKIELEDEDPPPFSKIKISHPRSN